MSFLSWESVDLRLGCCGLCPGITAAHFTKIRKCTSEQKMSLKEVFFFCMWPCQGSQYIMTQLHCKCFLETLLIILKKHLNNQCLNILYYHIVCQQLMRDQTNLPVKVKSFHYKDFCSTAPHSLFSWVPVVHKM